MRHTDRQTEYAALRATIRERGTVRMALVPFVFVGWAAVALATASMITAFVSLSTLIPLMVLAAGFETLYALHITVERIGRYVQVFHAESGDRWEHVAMTFGGQLPRPGIDPLFARLFILATSINFFPAALGGEPWEVVVIAVCHLALIVRIRKAQAFAGAQRAHDLAAFESIKHATMNGPEVVPPPADDPTS